MEEQHIDGDDTPRLAWNEPEQQRSNVLIAMVTPVEQRSCFISTDNQ